METKKKINLKKEIFEWILYLALAVLISLIIRTFLIERVTVYQHSMEPTLTEGDTSFMNKIGARLGLYKRGDIIVANVENEPLLIKRLIALGGDTVEIKGGRLYLNGELQNEPYIKELMLYSVEKFTVPEGYCYILGDNRNNSTDSHVFGAVPCECIVGIFIKL